MELSEVSKHFTEQILNKIVKELNGKEIKGWFLAPWGKKGDSYQSSVFRLVINAIKSDNSQLEIKLIIKGLPKDKTRLKIFRTADFFRNEVNFYTKVLPQLLDFQKNKKCPNPFTEFPKCYDAFTDGKNDYIVLEDVGVLGFSSICRMGDIDLAHCELVMKALGKFHAISLAFKDQRPEEFHRITQFVEEILYHENFRDWYTPLLKDACAVAIDCISKEYGGTEYETKTKNFLSDKLYDDLIELTSAKTSLSVISHGDSWAPNIMFKYDHSMALPVDSILIDFQLARSCSLVVDISMFIYCCTSEDLRVKYYDHLIKIYYESCCALINELGSNANNLMPFSTLQEELHNFGRYGCGIALEGIPLSMKEDDEVDDLNIIPNENSKINEILKIRPLKTKEKRLRFANAFKHAIDQGYIL